MTLNPAGGTAVLPAVQQLQLPGARASPAPLCGATPTGKRPGRQLAVPDHC